MSMPSFGKPPEENFFIYYQDETDEFAVHWRGNEWGTDHHADMRAWYHDPLSEAGYKYLLKRYGLPEDHNDFTYEKVRKISPEMPIAALLPNVSYKKSET